MKKVILFLCLVFISQCAFADEPIEVLREEGGIYILKIDTSELGNKIKPLAVDEVATAKEIYDSGKYTLVLNGGFFDMKTGGEISYVTIDGIEVQTPYHNAKLMSDLECAGRVDAVLNRAELRILEDKKERLVFKIAPHNEQIEKKEKIIHSLQAGPEILPEMDLAKESFLQYGGGGVIIRESASVTKRRERTVLAFKSHRDKDLYIIVFPNSCRVNMNEVSEFLKKHKFKHAMALDGGGSTSLYYDNIEVYSEGTKENPGRKVKSFLVIEK